MHVFSHNCTVKTLVIESRREDQNVSDLSLTSHKLTYQRNTFSSYFFLKLTLNKSMPLLIDAMMSTGLLQFSSHRVDWLPRNTHQYSVSRACTVADSPECVHRGTGKGNTFLKRFLFRKYGRWGCNVYHHCIINVYSIFNLPFHSNRLVWPHNPLSCFLDPLFLLTEVCAHSWRPATQDAHQPLCTSHLGGDCQWCQGDVDSSATLSAVLLCVAVCSNLGLVPHWCAGQEKSAEFQSWSGRYILPLYMSHHSGLRWFQRHILPFIGP